MEEPDSFLFKLNPQRTSPYPEIFDRSNQQKTDSHRLNMEPILSHHNARIRKDASSIDRDASCQSTTQFSGKSRRSPLIIQISLCSDIQKNSRHILPTLLFRFHYAGSDKCKSGCICSSQNLTTIRMLTQVRTTNRSICIIQLTQQGPSHQIFSKSFLTLELPPLPKTSPSRAISCPGEIHPRSLIVQDP